MNITYELLDIKDISACKEFMLGIIKNEFGYDFNPDWHWDIDQVEKVYLQNRGCFFVAKYQNKIVGTIAVRPYDKNYVELKEICDSNTASIWRHYIMQEYRRKGIGRKLLSLAENFIKSSKYNQTYLHTQRTIPGSAEYWLSQGFEIILENKSDPLKTVHMIKKIEE
jgi:ribosomal protein S18 acetylase RimI-like enzyme